MAVVENRFLLLPTALLLSVLITAIISVVSGQPSGCILPLSGVFLSLERQIIPNDSYVLVSDIDIGNDGLLCNTDRNDCCAKTNHLNRTAQGDWYFPGGTQVRSHTQELANNRTHNFFSRDRGAGVVRLSRQGDPPERGRFRCEVPNAAGVNVTVYVYIVDVMVTITASGTATAGESYSLECTVTVTGSNDQPTITWLDEDVEISSSDPTRTVSDTSGSAGSYSSTLTFDPLGASRAGTYTCRATLGSAMKSTSWPITVNVINIQVTPSSTATPLLAGQTDFFLMCEVSGIENLNSPTITYRWDISNARVSGYHENNIARLSLSPLAASHAGHYTCVATITSDLLHAHNREFRNTPPATVTIQFQVPDDITISHGPVIPDSIVYLTCTVVLNSESVDVPVIVNTEWTGPDGFTTSNTAQSDMGSTTNYISTAMVNSFGRNNSGEYVCSATTRANSSPLLTDSAPQSETATISVGVYLSLNGTVYANNSVIPITEIGNTSKTALQCITDRMMCCQSNRIGEWHFPDGIPIPKQNLATTYYRNRGNDGTVNLNLESIDSMTTTGHFCCNITDYLMQLHWTCAIIVNTIVESSGSGVAGELYTLTCLIQGTNQITNFQWERSDGNIDSASSTNPVVNSSSLVSMLIFSPLLISHGRKYTCEAYGRETSLLIVNLPQISSVLITSTHTPVVLVGNNPTTNISLTCMVELPPSVDVELNVIIIWSGPVGTVFTPGSSVRATKLNFTMYTSTVMVDNISWGSYTCQAIVNSSSQFLAGEINKTTEIIIMAVPVNTTLSRHPSDHIRIGDDLAIFCNTSIDTVASSAISNSDINITVIWRKADQLITDQQQMISNGHYDISEVIKSNSPGSYMYSSVLSINSLSFADSQIYTCTATISSRMGSFNTTNQASTIDIQLIPTPPNVTLGEVTPTGVSISWVQDDRDTYSGFEIFYIHHGPCFVNKTNESRLLNTTFSHTIRDLEEFNNYTLVVYAVNTAGRSLRTASNTKNFKTHSRAPTGRPQSLHVESSRSNSTSIHFLWDRVNCTERNDEVIGYNISYYPSMHSRYMKSDNISGTSAMERQYVATRLTPLTNYTFMVTVISSYNGRSFSLPARVTYQTNRTSEVIFFLNGKIHANNSIVDVNDIGSTTYEALLCLTNASNCCGGNYGNKGEWYLPNEVTVDDSDRMHFSKTRGPSVLHLTSLNDGLQSFPMGVHRCEIPDANGDNQSIYIGIYTSSSGVGEPMISNFPEYSSYNNSQIITCTSAGGPATTVKWSKDGNILRDEYEQLKRIINLTTAEYQSTLILGQSIPEEVIGNYTCRVSNARDEDTKTIRLHGIQTTKIENGVPLGEPLSLNCTTDLASINISWLDSNGNVLKNTSTQQLTWEIAKITDAHHSAEYTCCVVGPFGDQNKSITLLMAQPSVADSSSTVGGVVAALLLVLQLVVGISVTIFIIKRSKNKTFRPFHKSGQYKPRQELTRSHSLGDDDYTPAPTTGTKGESIEMKLNEEEKEKDYYFMDTSLLAGEHVKPIPVSEFSSHVERLHADRDKLFEMEYESMSKHPQSSHTIADIPHNKHKSRFANIFPYDSSRVKLKEISGEDGSDYINASHLDGYNKPKAYIGAQGPMPNTVTDFWRMIWEKKLPTVVMLTRCFEGRKKCEEYWPLNVGESVQPGHGITITLNSTLPFAEYSLRKMTLTCSTAPGSAPLKVTQYHFTGWPDHGVPQNGVTLINFIRRVRTSHPYSDSRPLLVHCSAGVGRTGAFIVLDSMLQRMQGEQNLNIYEFLKQLRTQRVLMVQTQAQYNFIHDALNELILCGDTEITAPNLRIVISRLNKTTDGETGYNKQFNLIAQMSPGYSESDYTQANMECNLSKNRYPNVLPNDCHRILLRAAAGSDYINASFIDGYRQRGGYIATQAPMENTVNDFWRMVWDYQSRAIVMLCRMKEDGKEACCPFLPEHKGDSEVYGKIRVKLVSKETTTDYVIQQLEVSEDKPHPQGHASSEAVMRVGVFHYIRWPKHGTPRGTAALLDLIQHINKTQMTSGNKPITVMCNDGVGRTGTFICIHAQLERLKTEGVVDFFQSIKSARIQRAGLVPDVHQYILCHNLVADYLDGFDTYANFKELV